MEIREFESRTGYNLQRNQSRLWRIYFRLINFKTTPILGPVYSVNDKIVSLE